jgi:hypothetical protein
VWFFVVVGVVLLAAAGFLVTFGMNRRSSPTAGAGWLTLVLAVVLLVIGLRQVGAA